MEKRRKQSLAKKERPEGYLRKDYDPAESSVKQDTLEKFSRKNESNPLVTISEAARMFRKSHQTVARWLRDGLMEFEGPLPGGSFGIRLSEIKKFIGGSALPDLVTNQEIGSNGSASSEIE